MQQYFYYYLLVWRENQTRVLVSEVNLKKITFELLLSCQCETYRINKHKKEVDLI